MQRLYSFILIITLWKIQAKKCLLFISEHFLQLEIIMIKIKSNPMWISPYLFFLKLLIFLLLFFFLRNGQYAITQMLKIIPTTQSLLSLCLVQKNSIFFSLITCSARNKRKICQYVLQDIPQSIYLWITRQTVSTAGKSDNCTAH